MNIARQVNVSFAQSAIPPKPQFLVPLKTHHGPEVAVESKHEFVEVCVVTKYAAQNQIVRGCCVRCIIVPAVRLA